MAAARVALALGLVVSASQIGGAEPCAPRAELGGDSEAVAKVSAELTRLGVDTSTAGANKRAASCPVVVAAVELDRSGGIAVAVSDAAHRSEGRVVSDAALAAAWIDSWLRDDFTGAPVELPAPRSLTAVAETAPPPPPSTPLLDKVSLAASFVLAWTDDTTRWSGVAASLCVRVGDLCVGGRAAYARQDVPADLTAAAKRDLSLLATASYPQTLGRMSIAPELGLGIGRLATTRIDGCKMDPNCDPSTNTMCTMPPPPTCETNPGSVYVGDGLTAATYTPRVSAALRVAIPLFEHVWLDGLAAATLAPFGHGDPYKPIGADGTVMTPALALPGDPLLGVQLGVGLRVGAP